VYRLTKDFIRALRLDDKLYASMPADSGQPAYLAEEALSAIAQHQSVRGVAAEGAEVHMKKLLAFMQSDQFGLLDPVQVGLFEAWLQNVGQQLQQARIAQAAAQFQNQLQAGGGAAGGGDLGMLPMQGQEPTVGAGATAL